MIKVVIIEDDVLALQEIEHYLSYYDNIEIVGRFIGYHDYADKLTGLDAHAVFIGVYQPHADGLQTAFRIKETLPETNIILFSYSDQYAVKAFEINALDYLLKPIDIERFQKTVTRLINSNPTHTLIRKLYIRSLGKLEIGWKGEEPIKWRSGKTKEIFAFLLHNEGKEVSKEEILESVFPHYEYDRATSQLYNGIYYIRKCMQDYGIERSHIAIHGNYKMVIGNAIVDHKVFWEKALQKDCIEALEQALGLYNNTYLAATGWVWAEAERQRLARQHINTIIVLARAYIMNDNFPRAEELLLNAYSRDPYGDEVTKLLIELYLKSGRQNDAIRHYRKHIRLIRKELGVEAELNIHDIIKQLQ